MPAFGDRLSDEDIGSILAYIKSMWPEDIRKLQADVTNQRGTGSR
jgi:mono/diheme cytochrome c family protein